MRHFSNLAKRKLNFVQRFRIAVYAVYKGQKIISHKKVAIIKSDRSELFVRIKFVNFF